MGGALSRCGPPLAGRTVGRGSVVANRGGPLGLCNKKRRGGVLEEKDALAPKAEGKLRG